MRLRDQQVLVVAMVADKSEAFGAAREVIAVVAGDTAQTNVDGLADQELRSRSLAAVAAELRA